MAVAILLATASGAHAQDDIEDVIHCTKAGSLAQTACPSLGQPALPADHASNVQLIACRNADCVTSAAAIADADFIWVWSADAPPVRMQPREAIKAVAHGLAAHAERSTIRISRTRAGDVTPLTVIAAPFEMWSEVPEPLLPRFRVPRDGSVSLPRDAGKRWTSRVIGKDQGSWWTPLERGTTTIVPLPAITRNVKITDTDGKPLASAGVTITVPGLGSTRTVAAQLRPDRLGFIGIESLPDRDPLTLIVSEKDHAPEAITEPIGGLPETIVLRAGAKLAARFIDGDKKPVAGVEVRAEGWLEGSSAVMTRKAVSDGDGRWTIDALPLGARMILAAAPRGLAALRKEITIGKPVDLGEMVLEKGAMISVVVRDDHDHRPVAGARLDAEHERKLTTDGKGSARLTGVSLSSPMEISATAEGYLPSSVAFSPPYTDLIEIELTRAFVVNGRFENSAGEPVPDSIARVHTGNSSRDVPLQDRDFRLLLQPGQPVSIELISPGTRGVRLDVEGKRGEVRDLGTLHPEEGSAVRGRVVTADGSPVPSASIWTPRTTAEGPVVAWARGNLVRSSTDASGSFTLRGAGPEPVVLRIEAPGYARAFRPVSFGGDVGDGELGDVELGDIVVTEGATVRVVGKAGSSNAMARLMLRPESGDVDTLTAAMRDGVAMFRHVPPGRSVVALMRGHDTLCEKGISVSERRDEIEIDCSASGVRVRGTVLVGERPTDGGTLRWSSPFEAPLAGVIMTSVSRLGAQQQQAFGASQGVMVMVDGNGGFESDNLRPGTWLVQWTSSAGGMSVPREVVVPEIAEATIILRYDEAAVRGIVLDEHSQPVRSASVRQTNGTGFALTGDDGTFIIVGLPPGPHAFKAEHRGLRSESAAVTVESGRQPDALRLVLRPSGGDTLSVRVLGADGAPAANALVFLETNTAESRIVTTDTTGQARIPFDNGVPASVRCAASHRGKWEFGVWRSSGTFGEGVTLTIRETGTLAVVSDSGDGRLDIVAPNDWDLRMLMLRIGWVPLLTVTEPLQIAGLPPGSYRVRTGDLLGHGTVRRGQTTTVKLQR